MGNKIGDEGAIALAKNRRIGYLRVGNNNMTGVGVSALVTNTNIESLQIYNTHFDKQGLVAIARDNRLRFLDISESDLSATDAALLKNMKSLETLYIDLNPIGDKGVTALAQNSSIKELSVAGCSIGSDGAIALSTMSNLEALNLNFNHIDERGSAALAKMKLQDLDLAGNWLYDEGVMFFADAKIDTLDVEYNRIENAGAKALAKNKGISYLDAQHNWIGQKGIEALKNSGIAQVYTDGNVSFEDRDDLKKQKSHHTHSKHRLVLDMFDKGGKKHHRVS